MLEKDLEIKSTNKQRRKLVDYLNEMFVEKFGRDWHFTYKSRFDEVHVMSKKCWFIEWLLGKNKIDLLKLTCMNPQYTEILDSDFSWEDRIIMILSIQDNPITFLLSVLK